MGQPNPYPFQATIKLCCFHKHLEKSARPQQSSSPSSNHWLLTPLLQGAQTILPYRAAPCPHPPFHSLRDTSRSTKHLSAVRELLPQHRGMFSDLRASPVPSMPLPPRLLIHHLDDFQGHRWGLLLVSSRLFHLPSSPVIISHCALLPRRIFHMPYLILRRLTLRRHDIPACSDTPPLLFIAHWSGKKGIETDLLPQILLVAHLQVWSSA